jgi:hypothetical protein
MRTSTEESGVFIKAKFFDLTKFLRVEEGSRNKENKEFEQSFSYL